MPAALQEPAWGKPVISKSMSAREILYEVARVHGVTVTEIKSKSRVRKIAWARHHACYLIRKHKNFSYPQIAAIVNLGDHTTVLHAIQSWPEKEKLNAYPRGQDNRIQHKVKRIRYAGYCGGFPEWG